MIVVKYVEMFKYFSKDDIYMEYFSSNNEV